MAEGTSQRIKLKSDLGFTVWMIGWLFTLGFLDLGFWKGVLAILVWPYYVGVHFAATAPL